MNITFCPHIQCACLNCPASITFSFPIFSTHLLFHQFGMEVRGECEAMVHGVQVVLNFYPNWVVLHVNFTNIFNTLLDNHILKTLCNMRPII